MELGKTKEVKLGHNPNANAPIVFSVFGKVMDINPRLLKKAPLPIVIRELLRFTVPKLFHRQKVHSPIEITELGKVKEVKTAQPIKAFLPIEVTELGKMIFFNVTLSPL